MSETSDPIDTTDLDLSSGQAVPMESQPGSNPIALDGSLPSIHSVSLILQALLPLIISLVFLFAGRRLYRFTTTVSVALSSALFTWAIFVNLESGQSIASWPGEVAAVTVWSVMIGGSLIGALIGYQLTWWGAHVTGRLCLGANSGLAFAFSVLLLKGGLLVHNPVGQWLLVGAFVIMGVFVVLWDHVIGPLVAITTCGSFLFLLGTDLFSTLGLDGVASGLRLLLDHNPDHSKYITTYLPPKSTLILIIVSWVIGFISFGLQYACYSVPFGPSPPDEKADEEHGLNSEHGLDSESKSKDLHSEIRVVQPIEESPQSELESSLADPSQAFGTSVNRGSNETVVGPKTSATLTDSNLPPGHHLLEPSSLPYLSSRPGPSGEQSSPAALALSPSVYSRYRRTQDPAHKPPSRSPIQYPFHSNFFNFTNPRRVETVVEVTESSSSVRGGGVAARPPILTVGGIPENNSMSEEYINAMRYLASGECNQHENDQPQTVGVNTDDGKNQDDSGQKIVIQGVENDAPSQKGAVCETSNVLDGESNVADNCEKQSEPNMVSNSIQAEMSLPSNLAIEVPSSPRPNHTSGLEDGSNFKTEFARPPNSLPDGPDFTATGEDLQRSNLADQISGKVHEREVDNSARAISNQVLSSAQTRCEDLVVADHSSSDLLNRSSQDLADVSQAEARILHSEGDPSSSIFSEDIAAVSAREDPNGPQEVIDPLVVIPSQPPTSFDRSPTTGKQDKPTNIANVLDTRSLQSAHSNGSSILDSFLKVGHDSSVPTTPSSTAKTLKEERKQLETVPAPTKTRFSLVMGKQAQLTRETSKSTQNSQEAQIDTIPHLSLAANYSDVPNKSPLVNMVSEVSEKPHTSGREPDITDLKVPTTSHQFSSQLFPREEESDNEDAATLKSEPSRKSAICLSSICADNTSAEEAGKSCSGSEDEDDQSREEYFNPRRMHELDIALGQSGHLYSDELSTEDEMEGSRSSRIANGNIPKRSPSLHSIPLPSRQQRILSSYATAAKSSMNFTPTGLKPFVGKPIADIPWPQMRDTKRNDSTTEAMIESQQKRWTTASSIFPPIGYESSTESLTPDHLFPNQDDEIDSNASDTGPDSIAMIRSAKISPGTPTSFEGNYSSQKRPGLFCSASSHRADRYDTGNIASRIDDSTDNEDPDYEDPDYESAADYSRSFRPEEFEGGYVSAEDGKSPSDF